MANEEFSLKKVGELDPRLDAQVALELRRIVQDMQDRPGVDAARKLTIELAFKPEAATGSMDSVSLRCKIKSSMPPVESRSYSLEPHGSGALLFNPASPDNVRQRTLDEVQ